MPCDPAVPQLPGKVKAVPAARGRPSGLYVGPVEHLHGPRPLSLPRAGPRAPQGEGDPFSSRALTLSSQLPRGFRPPPGAGTQWGSSLSLPRFWGSLVMGAEFLLGNQEIGEAPGILRTAECTCPPLTHTFIHTHTHVFTCTHKHIPTCSHMHASTQACSHRSPTHMCAHMHVFTHALTHAYADAHTLTPLPALRSPTPRWHRVREL